MLTIIYKDLSLKTKTPYWRDGAFMLAYCQILEYKLSADLQVFPYKVKYKDEFWWYMYLLAHCKNYFSCVVLELIYFVLI